jgi:hypothetical protein
LGIKKYKEFMMRIISLILALSSYSFAEIINIPSDYSTIQIGIDNSSPNDTVLVSPGTYLENINFHGKEITVGSYFLLSGDVEYILTTVIDGDSLGSTVVFNSGENNNSILSGFIITGGIGELSAGHRYGGGIHCKNQSDPILDHLLIINNSASDGGGIFCLRSDPIIQYTRIADNVSTLRGGGLSCHLYSEPILNHTTIINNFSNQIASGIFCVSGSNPQVNNSIIWGNISDQIYFDESYNLQSYVTLSYSAIENGLEGIITNDNGQVYWLDGNISENPLFCNDYLYNFSLSEISPCVGSSEDGSNIGAMDVLCELPTIHNGNIWFINNDGSDLSGLGTDLNPFNTIQHGIDMSMPFDTLILSSGVYTENILIQNIQISVLSQFFESFNEDIITNTIIDGNGYGSTISLFNNEFVEFGGLTITNGSGDFIFSHWDMGGGIYSIDSNLKLDNVEVTNNVASEYGGGIYLLNSNVDINNCKISNNFTQSINSRGGAMFLSNTIANIRNSTIDFNFASIGGGIRAIQSELFIFQTLINNNSSTVFGGGVGLTGSNLLFLSSTAVNNGHFLIIGNSSSTHIINSIVWEDSTNNNIIISNSNPVNLDIGYSNILNGMDNINLGSNEIGWLDGNTQNDPQFTNPGYFDYSLNSNSPCIDAGTQFFYLEGDTLISSEDLPFFYGEAPDQGFNEFLIQGDINSDGYINILDIVAIVEAILTIDSILGYYDLLDLNCDQNVSLLDIIQMINIILDL